MSDNQLDTEWKKVLDLLEKRFGKPPNMEALLFLVGVNEFHGRTPKFKFAKNEKEDLMHIGVCTLLSKLGYYELEKYDQEGWPHFLQIKKVNEDNLTDQETLLKEGAILYFLH